MLVTAPVLFILLASGVMCILRPRNPRWEVLFFVSLLWFPVVMSLHQVLSLLDRLVPYKWDQYAFYIEQPLGEPSFFVGQLLAKHHWLNLACVGAYNLQIFFLALVFGTYFLLNALEDALSVVRSVSLCALLSVPFYIAVPLCGPRYAFETFPNLPAPFEPHLVLIAAAPNGLPSIHFASALITLYFLSRWKIGFIVSSIFLVLTILATLGTGEHYLIDLIAAVPYAALMIYLGGYQRRHPDVEHDASAALADYSSISG